MQEYIKIDQKIHWLSQIIAKSNRTFVPKKKDDSHTNLYFDCIGKRLLGRWFLSPQGNILLSLDLKSMKFQWLNSRLHIVFETLALNKEMQQMEKDVIEYPNSITMDTEYFFNTLHYEIPNYHLNRIQEMMISKEELNIWMYYREMANIACQNMLGFLQKESEIRIWPHHFDTGIYAQVDEKRSLGFGLAMEDAMVGQPYYYLAGYNSESEILYKNLFPLSVGRWQNGQHWNGAVLTLNEVSNSSLSDAIETIKIFIKETTAWFLK